MKFATVVTGRILSFFALFCALVNMNAAQSNVINDAKRFIAAHEAEMIPLEKALGLAWWNANVTGSDADFKAKEDAQNKLESLLSRPEKFAELSKIRMGLDDRSLRADPILVRQINVLHLQYLEKQLDPELLKQISAKANAIEQTFNNYRSIVNGKEMTDSEVRKALKESTDSAFRKSVWEASKNVGKVVEKDLKALIQLRNEAARKLQFKNYHAMQLALNEQGQDDVIRLFDQLDDLVRQPLAQMKKEVDAALAKKYGITPAELRPWHYQDPFFQEAPAVENQNWDAVYANVDILALCKKFYAEIGLPVDGVLSRSDLFEKKGKNPHAFCTDIDKQGDVRVLANIVSNEYWMGTMLHELGHAVYSSINIPQTVPYVLRSDSHPLCTEGIAMMFEQFSKNADWLNKMGVPAPESKAFRDAGTKMYKNHLLIFAAWSQVMLRFEKSLYENPNQDLNKLWWDLVEKYQLVHRPEGRNAPDYASKIHIVTVPAYYHNYLMGQLFASQMHHTIALKVLNTTPQKALYNQNPKVGEFLKEKVFGPAKTLSWNDLARHATGSPLNPKAFAADLKP